MGGPRRRTFGRWWLAVALAACAACTVATPVAVGPEPPAPTLGTGPGHGSVAPAPGPGPTPAAKLPLRPPPPKVKAPSVVVEDLDSGQVLFATHAATRRPIASLTKIMTALVVLETTQPSDVVTVTKLAARQEPTALGLRPGARMQVHELMYALLLHSANDVAVALAQHVAGSVAAFDDLMTSRGRQLGLTDTRFASPSGLNDRGYSTARDVAVMARAACDVPELASIVATKWHTITRPSGKRERLQNLNDLLFTYPGAIGMKTGYTDASHWSLVGVAERGGIRLMVVLLGEKEHHSSVVDAKQLDASCRILLVNIFAFEPIKRAL